MLLKTGIPTPEDIARVLPPAERLQKGPVAIIECFQQIPCDPCCSACKRGAIREMADINECPEIDFEQCNGCGLCIPQCPGLAISVVDMTCADGKAAVKIPYEFTPLPEKGQQVIALDRGGNRICEATVEHVLNTKAMDRTPVITLIVPREHAMAVRFFQAEPTGKNYLCRCEEITAEEIRELIAKGFASVDEIKRLSRAGMGPCQGRTCRHLIMREIEAMTGSEVSRQKLPAFRPPVKPIRLGMLTEEESKDE